MSKRPFIWLQENEYSGKAGCGCRLVADDRGPKMTFCNMHEAADDLLAACQAVVDNWEHGDLAAAAHLCSAAIARASAKSAITGTRQQGHLEAVLLEKKYEDTKRMLIRVGDWLGRVKCYGSGEVGRIRILGEITKLLRRGGIKHPAQRDCR